jgi:hypothetical protein
MALGDGTNPMDAALYGVPPPGLPGTAPGYADDPFLAWYHGAPAVPAVPGAPAEAPPMPQVAPAEPLPGARDPLPEMAAPIAPLPSPPEQGPAAVPELPSWLGGPSPAAPSSAALPPPGAPPVPYGAAPLPPGPPSDLPDTITGGHIPTTVSEVPGLEGHIETHAEQYSGDPLANPVASERDAAMVDQATNHPEEFLRTQENFKAANELKRSNEALRLLKETNDKYLADMADRQKADEVTRQKSVQLDVDAQRIADTKLNSHRYMNDQGTLGKIAIGIGMIVGGLNAANMGGRNMMGEWLQKQIDNDVDAQRSDLDRQGQQIKNRQSGIAQEYAQHGDAFRAVEAERLANYDVAIKTMEAEQQKYAAGGTTSLSIGAGIADMRARRAQAKAAADTATQKHQLEVAKEDRERFVANANARHQQAEEALDLYKAKPGVGEGAVKAPYGTVYPDLNAIPEKLVDRAFPLPSKGGQPGGYGIAASPEDKKDATHLIEMYEQANYDINELQRISLERDGAHSVGGSIWDKWRSTNEQHYEQLFVDVANVYGMMIHGRAPTQGVLEEVMTKSAPELKSIWQAGDTTKLLDHFHNDIDNRTSLRLGTYLGNKYPIKSERPHIDPQNVITITAPLTAPAVKGAAGYARMDMGTFGQSLSQILDEYVHNRGMGDQDALKKRYNDIEIAQRKNASDIRGEILKLESKKTRSAAEDAQLKLNRLSLKDRNEAIRETQEARDANLPKLRSKIEKEQTKQGLDDTSAGIAP